MTQKKTQCPKLNSQVTKAEEKKVKQGLKDAFTVEELAAIKANKRSNVALMVGASMVMEEMRPQIPDREIVQFAATVKSAVRTHGKPGALFNAIINNQVIRNFMITLYANGTYHDQRIEDVMKLIDEEVEKNPKLKKHLDELTEKYKKQMEEARLKHDMMPLTTAEEAAKKAAEEQKNTPKH